jgi:hypothetical protein
MTGRKRTAQTTQVQHSYFKDFDMLTSLQGPSKRRKLSKSVNIKGSQTSGGRGKVKAADRGIIPLPSLDNTNEIELSDEDLEVFKAYGGAATFLDHLDQTEVAR